MDRAGRWQDEIRSIELPSRAVDFTVDRVRIIASGYSGASDGWFRANVFTGLWSIGTETAAHAGRRFPSANPDDLAELESGDVFGAGEGGSLHPTGPPWSFTLTRRPLPDRSFGVRLAVFDQDGLFEPNEEASGVWEAPNDIPVVNEPFFVRTDRDPPYVTASATGRYTIRYQAPPGGLITSWQPAAPAPAAGQSFRVDGDYDGDGSPNSALYFAGGWFIDIGGTMLTAQLGEPGDLPVPADYDRDGRVDLAVWRPQ